MRSSESQIDGKNPWPRSCSEAIGGLILPAPLIGYGLRCLVTGQGHLIGRNWNGPGFGIVLLKGTPATALGATYIALGLLIFSRLFVRNWLGFWRIAQVLEPLALLTIIASTLTMAIAWAIGTRW